MVGQLVPGKNDCQIQSDTIPKPQCVWAHLQGTQMSSWVLIFG